MGLVTKPFGTRPNAGADFQATTAKPLMQVGLVFQDDSGVDWVHSVATAALTTPEGLAVPAGHYYWTKA